MRAMLLSALGAWDAVTWSDVILTLLRLTVIGAGGALALGLARNASAAVRHWIAVVALGAMLATPIATGVLPAWRWAVLPATAAVARIVTPDPAQVVFDPQTIRLAPSDVPRAHVPRRIHTERSPLTPAPAAPVAPAAWTLPASPAAAIDLRIADPPRSLAWSELPGALALLAACGALLVLGRMLLGLLAGAIVAWRATPVTDPRILGQLDAACDPLGVRRVALRSTRRVGVPVVMGLRPVVLLPETALAWSPERLRLVFLHELAHVARGDVASLLVSRLAVAACWFHPLAHLLARVARHDAERAADDRVLASGVRATDYAGHLLEIAATAAARGTTGITLAMVRRSQLESRLTAIVRADAVRRPVSRRTTVWVALAALALLLPLASVRVVASPWVRPLAPTAPVHALRPITIVTADGRRIEIGNTSSDMDAIVTPAPPGEAAECHTGDEWYAIARAHYQASEWVAAGDAYAQAADQGCDRAATAYYNEACSYALGGRGSQAIGALMQAIDSGFDDVDQITSDRDLASLHDDGRYQLLVEDARESKNDAGTDGTDAEAASHHADDDDSPLAQYREMCASRVTDADQWSDIGYQLLHADDPHEAADAFRRQIAIEPSATGTYNLACGLARDHQTAAAFQALQAALLAGYGDPDKLRSDDDLESLRDDARFDRMVELASDLELRGPNFGDDPSGWRRKLPRYEDVVRRRPDAGRAWFNLGYARLRARDPRGGAEAFQKAFDLDYRKPTSMYDLACSLAQAGDHSGAITALERSAAAGMELRSYLRDDSDLDPLHGDPRFEELVQKWDGEQARLERHKSEQERHRKLKLEKEKQKDKDKRDES